MKPPQNEAHIARGDMTFFPPSIFGTPARAQLYTLLDRSVLVVMLIFDEISQPIEPKHRGWAGIKDILK